uniref:AB hydrolase-1 domain-containing protein n=1 Tax=Paramoeba aestuarina TaxID=180227 RepID=A0A7S4L9W9_9EUKA|eukprot:CAMPEP_0201523552 /NCGR_PEP_ID=MMETSP0161_2-20130828/20275_1 /ASSEMBLY_ACC=CAM_ASM_000251 /TAXON_ID=180227 /ORGANISM="Neoparamoeba aestuarina, Strain SoJaBio B1-5/56/2" /LENGTH=372 /DNA_ID=CAMNT_0047922709 /DNA_START=89 /DNA_END=1207 /DNA_ORIENTATION=+
MHSLLRQMAKSSKSGVSLTTYHSPWWLPGNGILETLVPELIPTKTMKFRREELRLPVMNKREGSVCAPDIIPEGIVSVDWLEFEEESGATKDKISRARSEPPIVILVPGLTGSSDSGYIRRTAEIFHSKGGFRVACFNPRGRGGNPLISPFLYSVGYTEDLRRAVAHIRASNPEAPFLFAVGYSLGSNYLAKYVAEEGEKCPLSGGVCLGGVVDCLATSQALESTFFGRIADSLLVRLVKPLAMENASILKEAPHWYDYEALAKARTMAQFDGAMISKSFGFSSASDYYRWSSSGLVLHQIRIPMLFLFAENDPVVGGAVRSDTFEANDFLVMCVTKNGGHSMDWFDGSLEPWAAKNAWQFCDAIACEGMQI